MARTDIPVQTIPFQGSVTDAVLTAGDATNDHEFSNDGEVVLFIKTGATPVTVTVVSVPDEFGRTGDEVYTVAADKESFAGPFIQSIWNQSGAKIHVDLSVDTNVELAAMKFSPRK